MSRAHRRYVIWGILLGILLGVVAGLIWPAPIVKDPPRLRLTAEPAYSLPPRAPGAPADTQATAIRESVLEPFLAKLAPLTPANRDVATTAHVSRDGIGFELEFATEALRDAAMRTVQAAISSWMEDREASPSASAVPWYWTVKAIDEQVRVDRDQPSILVIGFLGDLFLKLLKMIVIPLILASMIVGIASLGDVRSIGREGGFTLGYYLLTTFLAVCLGIILVVVINPGQGQSQPHLSEEALQRIDAFEANMAANTEGLTTAERVWVFAVDFIEKNVPSNLAASMANGEILPLLLFALLFGGVLTTLGPKGKPVIAFFEGIFAATMKIVTLIMFYAPIGIFALVATKVGGSPDLASELSKLAWYAVTVLLGLFIHGFIILPLILALIARRNPLDYMLGMGKALMTAFSTASSAATLPITMEGVTEENKVPRKTADFVLPLGATINMDGTALYEAVAVIFIAQVYGIHLGIGEYAVISLTATLAAIGAAAIPEAGLTTMVMVMMAVGVPIDGIGMILAIDWFLDRCRTTVNVWGDSVGCAVVDRLAFQLREGSHKLKPR